MRLLAAITDPSSTTGTLSSKVKASGLTTLALTVLAAALAGITPEMLDALGPWAGPVFLAIGALGAWIAGYLKEEKTLAAVPVEAPVTPVVITAADNPPTPPLVEEPKHRAE